MRWTEPVTATLPGAHAAMVRQVADATGRSVSAVVAQAVAAWLGQSPASPNAG